VREDEADFYRLKFPRTSVVEIPSDSSVKDIATTRNWILKNCNPWQHLVMVDDDMSYISRNLNRKIKKLEPDEIDAMIECGFQMAEDSGCTLWGLNVNHDPMSYSINKPLQFGRVVLGPFTAVLDRSILFDEELTLKEDYDFFLQHLSKARRVLRFDYLSYLVDHKKLAGGCQTYRTKEQEIEQNKLLRKKWGDVVQENTRFKGSNNVQVRTGL
jgi:hypothetical protein